MHNFVKNNQLQFASSCLMRLPSKIVKHVSDTAGVPVSASYKTCCSSRNHFNHFFWVTLVWIPDYTAVVQVGAYHGGVSLGLGIFAPLAKVAP